MQCSILNDELEMRIKTFENFRFQYEAQSYIECRGRYMSRAIGVDFQSS